MALLGGLLSGSGARAQGRDAGDAPPTSTPAPTSPEASPPSDDSAKADELRNLLDAQARRYDEQLRQVQGQRQRADEQRERIEAQQVELERQRAQLEEQERQLQEQAEILRSLQTQIDQLAMEEGRKYEEAAAAVTARLEGLEQVLEHVPESTDVVTVGDLPGSFKIPGTNASVKFGGFVKVALVETFDPMGSHDQFVTESIPPADDAGPGDEKRLSLSARYSRFNVDLWQSTDQGDLRVFMEGDFAGGSDTFRLRHAYGQFGHVLAGKTWSTFVDAEAVPEEIDFEGLSGRSKVRQAQVRWFPRVGENLHFSIALEDPQPAIGGGVGVSMTPDLVAGIRRARNGRHFRASLLLRDLRGQPDAGSDGTEGAFGWGASVSGRFRFLREKDSLQFQLNIGDGIGRYINDLAAAGGQDAVFSPTGELEPLQAWGGYVAYQHWWSETLRTTLVYSVVGVDNLDFQDDDAYRRTDRANANLLFSPTPRMDVGAELIWGKRENKDGGTGTARQLQVGAKYRF